MTAKQGPRGYSLPLPPKKNIYYKGPCADAPRGVDESFDLGLPHIDTTKGLDPLMLAKWKTRISGLRALPNLLD